MKKTCGNCRYWDECWGHRPKLKKLVKTDEGCKDWKLVKKL